MAALPTRSITMKVYVFAPGSMPGMVGTSFSARSSAYITSVIFCSTWSSERAMTMLSPASKRVASGE